VLACSSLGGYAGFHFSSVFTSFVMLEHMSRRRLSSFLGPAKPADDADTSGSTASASACCDRAPPLASGGAMAKATLPLCRGGRSPVKRDARRRCSFLRGKVHSQPTCNVRMRKQGISESKLQGDPLSTWEFQPSKFRELRQSAGIQILRSIADRIPRMWICRAEWLQTGSEEELAE